MLYIYIYVCVCEIRYHMRNHYFGLRFYNAAGLVVNASTSPTKRLAYDTDISGDAHWSTCIFHFNFAIARLSLWNCWTRCYCLLFCFECCFPRQFNDILRKLLAGVYKLNSFFSFNLPYLRCVWALDLTWSHRRLLSRRPRVGAGHLPYRLRATL